MHKTTTPANTTATSTTRTRLITFEKQHFYTNSRHVTASDHTQTPIYYETLRKRKTHTTKQQRPKYKNTDSRAQRLHAKDNSTHILGHRTRRDPGSPRPQADHQQSQGQYDRRSQLKRPLHTAALAAGAAAADQRVAMRNPRPL